MKGEGNTEIEMTTECVHCGKVLRVTEFKKYTPELIEFRCLVCGKINKIKGE